jgi:hypothetical protein
MLIFKNIPIIPCLLNQTIFVNFGSHFVARRTQKPSSPRKKLKEVLLGKVFLLKKQNQHFSKKLSISKDKTWGRIPSPLYFLAVC